jgi:hypothetical protein
LSVQDCGRHTCNGQDSGIRQQLCQQKAELGSRREDCEGRQHGPEESVGLKGKIRCIEHEQGYYQTLDKGTNPNTNAAIIPAVRSLTSNPGTKNAAAAFMINREKKTQVLMRECRRNGDPLISKILTHDTQSGQ